MQRPQVNASNGVHNPVDLADLGVDASNELGEAIVIKDVARIGQSAGLGRDYGEPFRVAGYEDRPPPLRRNAPSDLSPDAARPAGNQNNFTHGAG
jgi:hypothetical protein